MTFDVVVPTSGRPCLGALLDSLAAELEAGPAAPLGQVIVSDDRAMPARAGPGPSCLPALPALSGLAEPLSGRLTVVPTGRGGARGPAAARNAGWARSSAAWVVFLDDDVVVPRGWLAAVTRDLDGLSPEVAGSQGRISVPLAEGRRPTDWERNVKGLESARWATADMAYRRSALEAVGGFDERFPRAYREDADLGLRITGAGYRITMGSRCTLHPVRPASRWISLRRQRGNADDALMRALHGKDWRSRAGAPPGRRPRHIAVTAAAAASLVGVALRRPLLATGGAAAWAAGTAAFAAARIAPGPATGEEIATMLVTSAAVPPLATAHWLAGLVRARRVVTAR